MSEGHGPKEHAVCMTFDHIKGHFVVINNCADFFGPDSDADSVQRGEAMAALAMFIHLFFHLCIGSFIFFGIAEVFYPGDNYPGMNWFRV